MRMHRRVILAYWLITSGGWNLARCFDGPILFLEGNPIWGTNPWGDMGGKEPNNITL